MIDSPKSSSHKSILKNKKHNSHESFYQGEIAEYQSSLLKMKRELYEIQFKYKALK